MVVRSLPTTGDGLILGELLGVQAVAWLVGLTPSLVDLVAAEVAIVKAVEAEAPGICDFESLVSEIEDESESSPILKGDIA